VKKLNEELGMIKAEDHIGTVCGSGIGLTEDSIDALQAESEIY
jgi:hypothetical protein